MSTQGKAPDPQALAIAREMQERLHPAEVILLGSRAAGDHRPDSDVDLMAVLPGKTAARAADETLRLLLEGRHEAPVVNVLTMTREEFRRRWPSPEPGRPPATV
jgi:predicted nucleotidyltransferase